MPALCSHALTPFGFRTVWSHLPPNCNCNTSDGYSTDGCDAQCQKQVAEDIDEVYRDQKIEDLENAAGWWKIVGKGLGFVADIVRLALHINQSAWFKVLMDATSVLADFGDFIQAIADKVGGTFKHIADQASIWIQKGIAIINVVRGVFDTPFVGAAIQDLAAFLGNYFVPVAMGPMEYGFRIAATSLGEAGLDFMSAGAHWAFAQEMADENQAQADASPSMSIEEFCQQDGGCPQ